MSDNPNDTPETGTPGSPSPNSSDSETADTNAYWKANLRLLAILMSIWAIVSFGAGIIFRPFLDQFMLGGYPLGFWFAQQGSIYVFIALIFYYTFAMRRLERKYHLED